MMNETLILYLLPLVFVKTLNILENNNDKIVKYVWSSITLIGTFIQEISVPW